MHEDVTKVSRLLRRKRPHASCRKTTIRDGADSHAKQTMGTRSSTARPAMADLELASSGLVVAA